MSPSRKAVGLVLTAWLAACSNTSEHSHHDPGPGSDEASHMPCNAGEPPPVLGLMTSLPLNWELGTEIADFAQGKTQRPWQARALSNCYTVMPLDTLSPIDEEAMDAPLSGLRHLAIIQPRVLTPMDNVSLDKWVRDGGEALIVLDPLLTGHYDLPLGDPRRPLDTSLFSIPPVVTRWGLEVEFDEPARIEQGRAKIALGEAQVSVEVGSRWNVIDPEAASCVSFGDGYGVRCAIGDGHATLFGDAAVFEHREMAGENFEAMAALIDFAFAR